MCRRKKLAERFVASMTSFVCLVKLSTLEWPVFITKGYDMSIAVMIFFITLKFFDMHNSVF